MAHGFKHGSVGGGASLNFNVVGAPANLLTYPYSQTTTTHNGITFTDNGDGSITANGTATADAYFYVVSKNKLMVADGGTYTLTGCPSGGNASTYLMRVTDNITGSYWDDTGSGRTKELSTGGVLNLYAFIRIKSGTTVNKLIFRPLLMKGSGNSALANPKENTIWVETDVDITSYAFSATEPQRVSGNRNLFVYPYGDGTKTTNGITYTVNSDGSIKVNGKASANSNQYIAYRTDTVLSLPAGTYRLSGCPAGGSSTTYCLEAAVSYDEWATISAYPKDTGTGGTITLTAPAKVSVCIKVLSGVTVNNLVFTPQLEKGSAATPFVKGDATGQVWISTGTESQVAFNALKKNGIQVYPLSAKQYVSGAWVDKTAKSYQNGAWADWWDGELYKNGNTYENITGGWGATSVGINSNYPNTGAVPTVTYNSNSVAISIAASKSGLWYTKNKISLSGKTKLSVQLSNVTGIDNSQAYLQIRTGVSGYASGHSEIVGSATFIDGSSKKTSATIDLSSLSLSSGQTYYVCIGIYSDVSLNVNEIKLS